MKKIIITFVLLVITVIPLLALAVEPPTPPPILTRSDDRGPEIIFEQGFVSWGVTATAPDRSALNHFMGHSPTRQTTMWIAASKNTPQATMVNAGRPNRDSWLYVIAPTGNNVHSINWAATEFLERVDLVQNPHLQRYTKDIKKSYKAFSWQEEWVLFESVLRESIISATRYRLTPDKVPVIIERRRNPHFVRPSPAIAQVESIFITQAPTHAVSASALLAYHNETTGASGADVEDSLSVSMSCLGVSNSPSLRKRRSPEPTCSKDAVYNVNTNSNPNYAVDSEPLN